MQTQSRLALTDKRVKRQKPGKKRITIWDDPNGPDFVRGFGVWIYPTGNKTYFVRLKAPEKKSRYTFIKLGKSDEISCNDARDLAEEKKVAHRKGEPVQEKKSVTVSAACARFLQEYRTERGGRRINENAAWVANLRRLSEPFGSRKLETLSTGELQNVLDTMTKSTARTCKSNWSSLWGYAVHQRWIPNYPNPAKLLTLGGCKASKKGKRKRNLTDAEIEFAIQVVQERGDDLMALYLRVLAVTGHRPGELCRARWEDLVDGWRVHVRETKKGRPLTYPPIMEGADQQRERAALQEALADLRAITGDMEGLFGPDTTRKSAEKTYRGIARRWDRIVKKHESLQGIKLSHFRSTVATKAFETEKKAILAAAARLDHRDEKVTETSYVVQ